MIGRKLKDNEIVHHINLDSMDNRECNLVMCTETMHERIHSLMKQKQYKKVTVLIDGLRMNMGGTDMVMKTIYHREGVWNNGLYREQLERSTDTNDTAGTRGSKEKNG
jgi:hypothetical protein